MVTNILQVEIKQNPAIEMVTSLHVLHYPKHHYSLNSSLSKHIHTNILRKTLPYFTHFYQGFLWLRLFLSRLGDSIPSLLESLATMPVQEFVNLLTNQNLTLKELQQLATSMKNLKHLNEHRVMNQTQQETFRMIFQTPKELQIGFTSSLYTYWSAGFAEIYTTDVHSKLEDGTNQLRVLWQQSKLIQVLNKLLEILKLHPLYISIFYSTFITPHVFATTRHNHLDIVLGDNNLSEHGIFRSISHEVLHLAAPELLTDLGNLLKASDLEMLHHIWRDEKTKFYKLYSWEGWLEENLIMAITAILEARYGFASCSEIAYNLNNKVQYKLMAMLLDLLLKPIKGGRKKGWKSLRYLI